MVKNSSRVKFCGIYKITSPSGRVYIGQSMDIVERWKIHKRMYEEKNRNTKLFNSFVKYGVNNHKFELIKICKQPELNDLEIYYETLYDSLNSKTGLNSKGCGGNGMMPEDVRKRISKSHIGISPSQETREKLRKHNIGNSYSLGREISKETRQKLREANIGKKLSKETLKKIQQSREGYTHSEETKLKIKKSNTGKVRTEEARKNISIAHKGIRQSKETIEKRMAHARKPILNIENGIFYFGVQEAADSIGINKHTLSSKLNGQIKNNTPFIRA